MVEELASKTETQTIYQNIEDPDQEFFEELESTYELEIKLGHVIKWFAVELDRLTVYFFMIALIIFIATSSIFSFLLEFLNLLENTNFL